MEKNLKVTLLGQVFTNKENVLEMLELIKNKEGELLEPSSGNGSIINTIKEFSEEYQLNYKHIHAFEIDEEVALESVLIGDFFNLIKDEKYINKKFDTIIGNPPYVKYKNINKETKEILDMSLFNEKTNLYLFFIKKCVELLRENGELIFLVPRSFLKATYAIKMNKWLFEQGTFTDIIDYGENQIFKGFSPNCITFRFEKGNFSRKVNFKKYQGNQIKTGIKRISCINGHISFNEDLLDNLDNLVDASDIFEVRVGAASGANDIFEHENGNESFVYSETFSTGKLKKMFYNKNVPELQKHKEFLINRKIKIFNEKNWFTWGRGYHKTDRHRIYVNEKTRNMKPFFINDCKAYDGSIFGIFPKKELTKRELEEMKKMLNNLDWENLGFLCGGRLIFSKKSLSGIKLPSEFKKFK